MRIGVVSDTHNHLSNAARIVELFNAARVGVLDLTTLHAQILNF